MPLPTPDAMPDPTDSSALLALRERVRAAVADNQPLAIHGGHSKAFYGQLEKGQPLDTREYRGIVAYDPTELVITARAGTPLAEIHAALADKGQFLPFEPPAFAPGATVGGMVATGLSGPRRQAVGSVRDFVLGTRMIDAHGAWLSFGGQVMKNVAGYDVSRLLCGSLGILGLIAEVSLKVLPLPACERSLGFASEQAGAIRLLNEWGGQPLPVSASSWHDGQLHVRLSGARSVVEDAFARLASEHDARESDNEHWHALRDHHHPALSPRDGLALWRLSLPSTAPPLPLPGDCLLEWGGALRWLHTDVPADTIRAAARAAGGHATLFRGGDKAVGVFEPLPEPLMRIHRRLKAEFDPKGIFNPGRLYPSL